MTLNLTIPEASGLDGAGWALWGAEVGKFADTEADASAEAPGKSAKAPRKRRIKVLRAEAPGMVPAMVAAKAAASKKPPRAPNPSPDVQRINAEKAASAGKFEK